MRPVLLRLRVAAAVFWGLLLGPLAGPLVSELPAEEPPLIWKVAVEGAATSPPAVGPGGRVYLAAEDRQVHAFSSGGERRWSSPLPGAAAELLLAAGDGSVYALGEDKKMHRISYRGTLQWTADAEGMSSGAAAVTREGGVAWGWNSGGQGNLRVLRPDGRVNWQESSLGEVTGLWVLQEGVLALGTRQGELRFYASWGEPLNRFVLEGAVAQLAADAGGNVYAMDEAGRIYAISSQAVLARGDFKDSLGEREQGGADPGRVGRIQGVSGGRVEKQPGIVWTQNGAESADRMILAAPDTLLTYSRDGGRRIWGIDGVLRESQQMALESPMSSPGRVDSSGVWYGVKGPWLTAWDKGEPRWRLRVDEGWSGMVLASGTRDEGGGRLYAGGKDWVLYAFRAAQPSGSVWSQPRGTARQDNRVLEGIDLRRRRRLFEGKTEYEVLRGRSRSLEPDQRQRVLSLFERRMEEGTLREDYPFADLLLMEMCRDGTLKPVQINGRIVNRFPQVQIKAAELLGRGQFYTARPVLLELAGQAQDEFLARTAVESLGRLGSDPDGAAVQLMARKISRNSGNSSWASSVLLALETLTEGASSLSREEQDLISRIAQGDYPLSLRRRAFTLLESSL